MDHRCPSCKRELKGRLLKTRGVEGGPYGMKVLVPQCYNCKTLLAPVKYREDVITVVVLATLAAVLAAIGQIVDERYSPYLVAVFVIGGVATAGWYQISGLNRRPKWRVFVTSGESGEGAVDPHVKGIRQYQARQFGKPKRRENFHHKQFAKNLAIYSVAYSVITAIFLYPEVESVWVCLYAAVAVTLAVCSAEIINGFYEMGQSWSQGIQIAFLGVFAIVAYYAYPAFF